MNEILQQKINELDSAKEYECWYLVKQDTSFISLCYQVEYLRQFKENPQGLNLETFIKKSVGRLKSDKPNVTVSETHRALRVAAFFGLISMTTTSYSDATITPTFLEIRSRTNGSMRRQICIWILSSDKSKKCLSVRALMNNMREFGKNSDYTQ
ncbi:hypothetical protein A4W77_09435 (plasmid) [Latilactobacillus curvatus]|nr:hypothetical protein A4W77_09435 [Latilactobacillus curvatus]